MTEEEFEEWTKYDDKKKGGLIRWFFLGPGIAWFFVGSFAICFFLIFALGIRWNIVWERLKNGSYDWTFFR